MARQTYGAPWLWAAGAVALTAVATVANGTGCGALDLQRAPDPAPTSTSSGTGGDGGDGPTALGGGDAGVDYGDPGDAKTNECPRAGEEPWYSVEVGKHVVLDGDTDDYTDEYTSFCGDQAGVDGNDVVYSLRAANRGTLTLSASSSLAQPVVYVEEVCGVRTTYGLPPDQLPCMDTAGQQIELGVTAGQTFFVIVEGGGSDGSYQVDLDLAQPVCGDGVINPANDTGLAEQCDPGTSGSGAGGAGGGGAVVADGCDDSCRFETPVAGEDGCPGRDVAGEVGQPIAGFTVGYTDDFQPGCANPGGPDRLYYLWLEVGEVVQVDVDADFDVVVALVTDCDQPQQPTHCVDSAGVSKQESLELTAAEAGFHHIVVDGFDGASWGSFTLTVTKS